MKLENTLIKKTKIISTMGPTFESEDMIKEMVKRGVNVVRLNTSHGDFEEHGARIANVKKVREELNLPISILLDTKGPEIRVHQIENKKMTVTRGEQITIYCNEEILGKDGEFSVTYTDLAKTVEAGQLIMVDDGKLTLKVISSDVEAGKVVATAENNHYIGTKKAVNVPGADLTLPFIAEHDSNFIKWGIEQGIDYVAASFVRDAKDVLELRKLLDENGGQDVLIMSKIEALKAIDNLNEIVRVSDSIMLARGDLGVEIPYFEVPFVEKNVIDKCRAWGKPVVIATQMLDSMMENPRPTRAEVTDVYYAAISGTDATMLSGESASGDFPKEAVETMATINLEAEKNFNYLEAFEKAFATTETKNAHSAFQVAKKALTEDVKYVIAFSEKGRLIKALSTFRLNTPVLALIKEEKLVTKFGANYGIYAQAHSNLEDYSDDAKVSAIAKEMGVPAGTKVIVANKNDHRKLVIA